MLESVENYLSQFGKLGREELNILLALQSVDRKRFMLGKLKRYAYHDTAMPIGHGQTISQPSTVARMLVLLELKQGDSVLEVGAGSGWNAGLISELVGGDGKVLSLDVVEELVVRAKKKIEKLMINNVKIEKKDFRKLKEKFDKIIFTAGISGEDDEKVIIDFAGRCLDGGGVLVCPFRAGALLILRNVNGKIVKDYTEEEYVFVPLVL